MIGWSRMRAALRNLRHQERAEADLEAEVRACAEMIADEKLAGGLPAEEARRRALVDLGGAEQVKQAVRDERWGVAWRNCGRTYGLDCDSCDVRPASL